MSALNPYRVLVLLASAAMLFTSFTACAPVKVVEDTTPPRDFNAEAQELIELRVDGSHPRLLAGSETEAVVWLEVEGKAPPGEEHRVGLNFSLVIDHSGSMRGDQLDDAKKAIVSTLAELHPDDIVSVVSFSSRVNVLMPQTRWGDADVAALTRDIESLEPQGTTAMYEALYEGYSQVATHLDVEQINRVILFSDGVPNDATHINSVAQSARNSGIAITTMGLGPQYNEDLMIAIADVSGGNYHFIADSSQIVDFFLAEKRSMERQLSRNTSFRFTLGSGVALTSAYGAQIQSNDGRQIVLFLGDLGVGQVREVALKLRVNAPEKDLPVELLDTFLTWEDVIHGTGTHERWSYLEAQAVSEQASVDETVRRDLLMKLSDLEAAAMLDQAMRAYSRGQTAAAQSLLNEAAENYRISNGLEFEGGAGFDPNYPTQPSGLGQGSGLPSRSRNIHLMGERPDVYLDSLADDLEEMAPESDEGKTRAKKEKSMSRGSLSID